MKVQFDKELKNNCYYVKVSVLEPDVGNYLEGVHDFGEEAINFGGSIMDSDGSTSLATLSDRYVKISDLIDNPLQQSFQAAQYGENAKKVVNGWIEMVKKTIDTYVKEVAAKADDFSGTEIIDV